MLKVNSKISPSSQEDMDELGKLRKSGKWIVTNRTRTIVKFIGSEKLAKEFFTVQSSKKGGAYLVTPLRTIKITKAEQVEYHRIHAAISN